MLLLGEHFTLRLALSALLIGAGVLLATGFTKK
jgi:drug/metabolite transporter (DMT)-like permease